MLYTENFLKRRIDNISRELKYSGKNMSHRTTGKSLSLALIYVSQALEHPETVIEIEDHYRTKDSDQYLKNMVRDIIYKLELEGFHLEHNKYLLTFSLDPEFEPEWK